MERAILQDPKQVPAPPIQCYPSVFQLTVTHIQHFALTVPGGQGSIQNRSLKIVTSTMLPWRVMNIERHWDVQENSVRMRVPDRYLGAGNSKRVFNRKTIFRGYLTTAGS